MSRNDKLRIVQGVPKNVNSFDNLSLIVEKSEISEWYIVGKINVNVDCGI